MFGRLVKRTSRVINQLQKSRKPLAYTPEVEDKHFLFIGGLHRSGTSILHRLLQEHPLTSGFHDTGVLEDEGQHLQTIYKAAHFFGGPGEFAFYPDAHLTESSELITQQNKDQLLRDWGAYYDLQKQVLLEKSPPNLIRSRFLRQLFPGSSFVFIVRHPIAVSLATEKWSNKTITERMLHWHTAYSIMLKDISEKQDCLVLRYEDLVKNQGFYMDMICDLVGIHRFSVSNRVVDHNQKYFRQWQEEYINDIDGIQAVFDSNNSVLKRYGYLLVPPFVEDV